MGITFDIGATTGAKEGGLRITAGIHKAKFVEIKKDVITSQAKNENYNVMTLVLDVVNYGNYSQNFFEPTSSERPQLQWGVGASQVDHFLIAVRQILDALNPEIGEKIDKGVIKLTGSFVKIVDILAKETAKYAGTEVEIKLVPKSNGYCSMPTYVARIAKDGTLGISTKMIGHTLVLTPNEKKAIDNAATAKPTDMKKNDSSELLDNMRSSLNESTALDDLPF